MRVPIDEVVYFDAITSSSTGAATDADSTPTFEVFEEATDTDIGVGGNMTKRTSKTGNYRCSFTASAANGFEAGKWYSVVASATVGGVAAKGVIGHFQCVPAEASAGVPKVDASHINAVSTSSVTAVNANVGTTQPVNFTGAGASALVKGDTVDWAGAAVATPDTAGYPKVTIKDGTGTGEIDTSSGKVSIVSADITSIQSGLATSANQTTINNNVLTAVSQTTAASIRSAVGLGDANLDTQLAAIAAGEIGFTLYRSGPTYLEVPASGSKAYVIKLTVYSGALAVVTPDSAPTVDLRDGAGNSLASRIAITGSAGQYTATYTSTAGDDLDSAIVATWSVTYNSVTKTIKDVFLTVDEGGSENLAADVIAALKASPVTGGDDGSFAKAFEDTLAAVTTDIPGSITTATEAIVEAVDDVHTDVNEILNRVPDLVTKGTTAGTPTSTTVQGTGSDLSATDDVYNNMFFVPTEGAFSGIPRRIIDYVGATKTFTVAAYPSAVATGIAFTVIGKVETA